jgi:dTDP-4-dehydrorhamnose reductase
MTGWLVTGAAGMLGQELVAVLTQQGEEVTGLTRRDLDITDAGAVLAAMRSHRPEIVVNCAAWTAIDEAEAHEAAALRVNGDGAGYVAAACGDVGARLVHISSDHVFAGDGTRPYAEDEPPSPSTAYGRTRLAGERAVRRELGDAAYVVRTAWVYGAYGPNVVRTMIRLQRQQAFVEVADDQRGQPTWAADVASQVTELIRAAAPAGIYHATSSGETTWFGLAQEVFRLLGADEARVRPVTSAAYPRSAGRRRYSVLGHAAWATAGIKPADDWRTMLRRAFPELSRSV